MDSYISITVHFYEHCMIVSRQLWLIILLVVLNSWSGIGVMHTHLQQILEVTQLHTILLSYYMWILVSTLVFHSISSTMHDT